MKKKITSAADLFIDLEKIADAFNKGEAMELSQDTGTLCITQIVCPITHENTCNASASEGQICCAITRTADCMQTRDCESVVYCAESLGRACIFSIACEVISKSPDC